MLAAILGTVAAGAAIAVVVLLKRHARAVETARRWEVTAQVSGLLAEALDVEGVVPASVRLFVPTLADWCAVHVVDDHGPRRLALVHGDPAMERELVGGFSGFDFDPAGAAFHARIGLLREQPHAGCFRNPAGDFQRLVAFYRGKWEHSSFAQDRIEAFKLKPYVR